MKEHSLNQKKKEEVLKYSRKSSRSHGQLISKKADLNCGNQNSVIVPSPLINQHIRY